MLLHTFSRIPEFGVCVFGPGLASTDKMLFCEKCKIAFVTAFH